MSVTPVTEVSRLELFFDLVFVVTITQFTTVLERRPSATGVVQAALMLAIVWWMYGGYAWLTNLVPPDRTARRLAMVAGMISYLVLALAIPRAFEGEGLAFGLAYLLVVIVHGGLFTVSTQVRLSTIYRGFFPVNVAFALVIVAGGALGGGWQYALWALTAAAAWTSPYLIADQSRLLGAKHFVERHALVVLVAIGESVVAIAIGASAHTIDAGTISTVALGMAISAGLWWAYFGDHDDELRVAAFIRAVADGRYLVGVRPFGLVFAALLGAVVAVAAGLHHAIAHPDSSTDTVRALYLGAGAALFLVADQISRAYRGSPSAAGRLAIALAALATVPSGMFVSNVVQETLLAAVLAAGFALEGTRSGRRGNAGQVEQPLQQHAAVGRAQQLLDRVLGVRHQRRHVALVVGHAGHRADRAVGVVAVAQQHLAAGLQLGHLRRVGEPATVVVLHRDRQHRRRSEQPGQPGRLTLDRERHVVAPELEAGIRPQHTRHQAGLGQHLEAVADAQHRPPGGGVGTHALHHRRQRRQGARPQVVAVAETAGDDHGVHAAQVGIGVPEPRPARRPSARRHASHRGHRRPPDS